jgi:tetraacyldisaccharide 4'-kinase
MIRSPALRLLAYPLAKLYQYGVRARLALYENNILKSHALSAPVISVGNLTVGGTGKTPCVAWLANFLRGAGHEVAILSRGYKRASRGRVEVSDGQKILCTPHEAGDEPYLLAQACPGVRVVVDHDRYAAGQWLAARTPISVFILDDAFQHLRLRRDLNLLLLDATAPLDDIVPLGRLREPLAGLYRADAVIVTRADQEFDRAPLEAIITRYGKPDVPIFYAWHEVTGLRRLDRVETLAASALAQQFIATLAGIARPERFIADLTRQGMNIVRRRDFPDHHRYTHAEFQQIIQQARAAQATAIITTEKDAANLPHELLVASALPVYAAQIEFRCADETALQQLVLGAASR